MRDDIRPMSHELCHVWITGDGRYFLNKHEAEQHQKLIERLNKIDGGNKKEL